MRGENPGTLCGKNKDIPGSTRKGCKTCPDTLWFTLMPFLSSFVVEVADTLSRIIFRSFSLSLLLLTASGTIRAQAQDPFTQNRLPDLGMMPESHEGEKHFTEMAKAFGEASMKNNDLDTGEQARQFAFGQVRDVVSEQVNQQLESWLSAWGSASVDINVDNEGHFNGSRGSWFIPLQDKQRYLTWSQLGLTQQTDGLVSNVGIGQRWAQDGWLLGYNTFTIICWMKICSAPALARRRGENICVYPPTIISLLPTGRRIRRP